MTYVAPAFKAKAFTCPTCGVFAAMSWGNLRGMSGYATHLWICDCGHCRNTSVWIERRHVAPDGEVTNAASMLDPMISMAPAPHPEMPDSVAADYKEAAEILVRSPRAAAALLRLAVQKLCKELGEPGKNINDDIGSLVRKGLPPEVQVAMDSLRVVGNNAVHPGEILEEDVAAVSADLFEWLNFIVEDRIARPKKLNALYKKLPQGARDAISKRDTPRAPNTATT